MANVPTVSWSETTPAGSESRALGDSSSRGLVRQQRTLRKQPGIRWARLLYRHQ